MAEPEMVERVARALLAHLIENDGPYSLAINDAEGPRITLDGFFDMAELARAAIGAMREPTEGMVKAMIEANILDQHAHTPTEQIAKVGYAYPVVNPVWRAGIDEAMGR